VSADLVVRGDAWDVAVEDGLIAAVGPELPGGREEIDARGLLVLPGMVDGHVHIDDPGRADWEGWDTGTAALAAGGVTCCADMPLNSIPATLDGASFDAKVAAARGRARVDFALWGGLVPGNLAGMDELAGRGVVGFKAFMSPSGVPEFAHVDPDLLGRGMERAAALGLPVAVHAEDPAVLDATPRGAGRTMIDWCASRPATAEASAVRIALDRARATGCAVHLVHLSSPESVDLVAAARSEGVDATCEACPHHLVLTREDGVRIGAAAKCAPPLRSAAERAALWPRLAAGAIDVVGSDHSPGPPELKRGDDMFAVWGGISGAQTTLPLLLTHGPGEGVGADRVAQATSAAPARRLGLEGKGGLRPGADADLALVRADAGWALHRDDLLYRHPVSPYLGMTLTARVERTIVRGVTVHGPGAADAPTGRLVTRARAAVA
jgi:allantoinase